MRLLSPLRYPGGKSSLAHFLWDIIEVNGLEGCAYYEPYAGGAGAALSLLKSGIVSEIFINDADERIHAFWHSVLNESAEFANQISSVPLTIDEWHSQYKICKNPAGHNRFDVGFAAFYMNRCNRSGVLSGAGPIGGLEQNGTWKLDVRFSREALVERILGIAELKSNIHLTQSDALDFLKTSLPKGKNRSRVFVYLDPPYVNKGRRLYLNAYDKSDHAKLARYIQSQTTVPWVMSYDDTELVRDLYADQQIAQLPIQYSLQEKRSAQELIIAPSRIILPKFCRIYGRRPILRMERSKGEIK